MGAILLCVIMTVLKMTDKMASHPNEGFPSSTSHQ